MQGKVLDVNAEPTGSATSAAASIGATTINLYDTADFDEQGGQFIDTSGNIVSYSTKDDDLQTITCTALTVAIAVDDLVQPYPYAEEKWALVSSEEEEDGVLCLVPHNLQDKFEEGIREDRDQETVDFEYVDEQWQIRNIVAEIPSISGQYVTTGSGDPLVPTEPPAISPAIQKVTGTTNGVIVTTDETEPGAEIEYHISATSGFTASPTTRAISTQGTVGIINKLPDGSLLNPNTTYYFVTVATNVLGSAAQSAEMSGQIDMTNLAELILERLAAGFAIFDDVTIGQMTLNADHGMTIAAPGGGTILDFPVDGSELSITAHLEAQSLQVDDALSIYGSGQVYGDVEMMGGITAPSQKLGLTKVIPTRDTGMTGAFGNTDVSNLFSGLIERPGSTTDYANVGILFSTQINFTVKATGAGNGDMGTPPGADWRPAFYGWGGLCYAGTPPTGVASYFVLGQDGNRAGDWYIYRINATTNDKISEMHVGTSGTFGSFIPKLASDGTNVGMCWVNSSKHVMFRWYVPTTANNNWTTAGADLDLITLGARGSVSDVHYGTAGTASNRIWVSIRDVSSQRQIMSFSTAGAHITAEDFDRGAEYIGMTYDSTAGQMVGLNTLGQFVLHGKYTSAKTIKGKMAWYDNDATGGTHETLCGPDNTLTLPSRWQISVTPNQPPDYGGNPADHDKADQVRVYVTDDAGATWHLLTYSAPPWGSVVPTLVGIGTGTPNAGTAFPPLTVPGQIRSNATDAGVDAITYLNFMDGTGKFRFGNYGLVRHYGSRTNASNQSIATSTSTPLTLGTAKDATTGMSWTNTTGFTIAKPGLYQVSASVQWDNTSATGRRYIVLQKNNAAIAVNEATYTTTGSPTQTISTLIPCVVGDVINIEVFQSSGGALNVIGGNSARTYLSCGFVGQ